jgi:DNA-directed RNA polymerase subunit RPC12/RpoP
MSLESETELECPNCHYRDHVDDFAGYRKHGKWMKVCKKCKCSFEIIEKLLYISTDYFEPRIEDNDVNKC